MTETTEKDLDPKRENTVEETNENANEEQKRPDIAQEILKLTELSMKYPEIGPPLAELAFKTDHQHLGDRILRMGLQNETQGVEYHFLSAKLSRRKGEYEKTLETVTEAVRKCTEDPGEEPPEWKSSLLHLIRLGFAVLMFDIRDLNAKPEFTQTIAQAIQRIQQWFGEDPFFLTLAAQAEWFQNPEESEHFWERAVLEDREETSWNSRGTWYKEAEKNLAKAEETYKQGILAFPKSPLLHHNLAQVVMERTESKSLKGSPEDHFRKAHSYLRTALRESHRPQLRRHIHQTMDRLRLLRSSALRSAGAAKPRVGEIVRGTVRSLQPYGAFIDIGGDLSGLLHKSEMAFEWVEDPAAYLKPGDEIQVQIIEMEERDDEKGLRIGLSRKRVLNPTKQKSGEGRNGKTDGKTEAKTDISRSSAGQGKSKKSPSTPPPGGSNSKRRENDKPLATLGDLLRAQLQQKEKK